MDLLDNQLEQLADELHRRRQGPNSGMRSSSGDEEAFPKVPVAPSPAQGGTTSHSRLTNGSPGGLGTGNLTSAKRRPTQPPVDIEDQDPTQMLNTWLGELDLLQRGLQETPSGLTSHRNHPNGNNHGSIISSSGISMTPSPLSSNSTFGSNAAILSSKGSNSHNNPSSRESSATPIHMRRMSTPRVESPRLDSYRYSLINLEETLDNDLDAILGELCALESNLNQNPARKSVNSSLVPNPHDDDRDDPTDLPPPPAPLQLEELLASEPQYITAESVRQNKLLAKRTDSPDNDSAFCENASSDSSNTSDNAPAKSSSSILVQSAIGNNPNPLYSSRKPSVGQETQRSCLSSAHNNRVSAAIHPSINEQTCLNAATQAKAEKIRLALEKIKEASIKKIFIKVFGEDGSTKSLLVDERMSVSQVCGMLAEKNYVKRDTSWALVELLPDLHMERAYEDHECLVENLLMWKADSKNTLWFIKRPEVYDLFNRPELYLLGDTSSQIGTKMEERARSELIEEYFSSTGVGAPEVEGYLWLKAEGKKTWKKFYFVLRTSGLYYAPKGKKTSKDLVCLARLDMNQVYFGVKWQPKFKSPSKHCLAIKHPQIQAKNPKYIRYLCADTEIELNKWVTGIRLAKYGKTIYTNYRGIIEEMTHEDLDRLASARNSLNTSSSPPGDDLVDEAIKKGPRSHLSHLSSHPSSLLSHSSDPRGVLSSPQQPPVTTVIVHSSHNGGVQCRSSRSSSASLSDRSVGCGSVGNCGVGGGPGEQGFSCDSPEGGTIKKKPIAKSSLLSFKAESERETNGEGMTTTAAAAPTPKEVKEVRFQDHFSVLPLDSSTPYATIRREKTPQKQFRHGETAVFQNIEDTLANHKHILEQSHIHRGDSGVLKRRYSNESINSIPASTMLHSGVIISDRPEDPIDNQLSPGQLSPQPERPAPILKPLVSRKPIVDKSILKKKQISLDQSRENSLERKPTYEDTLKKCQSLTRNHSSPGSMNSGGGGAHQNQIPVSRQKSCPETGSSTPAKPSPSSSSPCTPSTAPSSSSSPPVPPKPSLAYRAMASAKLDNSKKISHLPPTGLGHNRGLAMRSPTVLRQNSNNSNGHGELIGEAKENLEETRPFPNRLSSGEYDNVNRVSPGPEKAPKNQGPAIHEISTKSKKSTAPPLPKRNEETHLSWNRS